MSDLILAGGRVIDPANGVDAVADVLIREGRVAGVGKDLKANGGERVSVTGLVVAPGFIDMHVHLREPGEEGKETIATGTRAAARGGVTGVACMPNTSPPLDSAPMIAYVLAQARRDGVVRVYPIGCISNGRKGEVMADLTGLKEAGVVAFSDDGTSVMNALLAKRAMTNAEMLGTPYIEHAEDENLVDEGVMHEGRVSLRLGLSGRPPAAEEVIVARDIILAADTGVHLHVAHVSAAGSVEMIREAKRKGLGVTGEVTPHHLALTDEAVEGFNTQAKVNPPLRDEETRQALVAAVKDGTIDAIASDHAPHGLLDKEVEFNVAAAGMIGLETMLPLCLETLVRGGAIGLSRLVHLLSAGPARILNLPGGSLAAGAPADVVVFDPEAEVTVNAAGFSTKSRNTPFDGWKLHGRVIHTLVEGRFVVREGRLA